MKKFTSNLCSVCLLLFLVDGGLSLLDETLGLANVHEFAGMRALASLVFILVALATYVMVGVTPMVPKRWFLPVIFFTPVGLLGLLLVAIYHYDLIRPASWFLALAEVILGLVILRSVQGKFAFRWPLVPEARLGNKAFGWANLAGFIFANVFVLVPAALASLVLYSALAVDHLTDGFLALQTDGLVARAKTFARDDGKTILLMPMMHMGEPDFYAQITKSFPPHSVILLEGVTDHQDLQGPKLDYSRAAMTLGLCGQKQNFPPVPEEGQPTDGNLWRYADVDVGDFSKSTIVFLNLVARLYVNGPDADTLQQVFQVSPDERLEEQLLADLLLKRNAHVEGEIKAELRNSNSIVVPWGAAHMPGISAEIKQEGFHLTATQEFKIFNFRTVLGALSAKSE